MARLPTAVDLGGAPSVRSSRPIATFDATAIGEGVQDLASGLSTAAAGLSFIAEKKKRETDETNKFQTQRSFLEFTSAQEAKYNEMQQNAEPGALGFQERFRKSYMDDAKQWLAGVPEDLKPEYDLKLFGVEDRLGGIAGDFEQKERTRYFTAETSDALGSLENKIANDFGNNFSNFQTYVEQGADLIRSMPNENMNPRMRAEFEKTWRETANLRLARARIDNGQAARVKRELTGGGNRSFVDKIIGAESGGQADARNPASSATGYGQFIDSTWRQFIAERHPDLLAQGDVMKLRSNRAFSREAVQWYAEKNAAILSSAGLPVNDGTLYLAHFAGPQGAVDLLRGGDAPAREVLGADVVKANPFLKDMTAEQVVQWAYDKMGKAGDYPSYEFTPENRDKLLAAADRQIAIDSIEFVEEAKGIQQYLADGNVWEDEDKQAWLDRAKELGLESEKLKGMVEDLQRAEDIGEMVRQVSDAPVTDIEKTFEALKKRTDEASPEDYAEAKQDLDNYAKVVGARQQAVATDSARYAQDNDEAVADKFARFQEIQKSGDMQAVSAAGKTYAASLTAFYDRLQVPPEQRRILTKKQAELIGRQFADMEQGSQDSAQLIQSLQAQWGDLWPQIQKDIAPELPGLMNVLAGMPPGLPAERLAAVATIPKDDLEKPFATTDRNDAKEAIRDVLVDFAQSIPRNVNNAQVYSDYHEAIYRLALDYASRGDSSPEAAVQDAYDDIIGDHYVFENINGTPLRIPRSVDVDAVWNGAVNALSDIATVGVDLPDSAIPDEDTRASYETSLRGSGYWVTSDNEDGIILYDSTDAVVTKDGKPVRFTWGELTKGREGLPRKRELEQGGTWWPGADTSVDPLMPGAEPMRR